MNFGQNKVRYETFQWQVMSTPHFDIYFPEQMIEVAKKAMIIAEEAVIRIDRGMRYQLSDVVPIVLYPSVSDFQSTNIIPYLIGEGTGGFTESRRKRVAVPFTGSYAELRHVLTHEIVHVFQYDILLDANDTSFGGGYIRLPLWMIEGMAEYFSLGWDDSVEMTIRDALVYETLPTIDELNVYKVPNFYSIYKVGQSIVYYISHVHGERRLGEIMRDMRDSSYDFDQTLRMNLGYGQDDLNKHWRNWLKKRYYPLLLSRDFIAEGATVVTNRKEDGTVFNFKPVISPNGRQIAFFSNDRFYATIVAVNMPQDIGKTYTAHRPHHSLGKREILITANRSGDFEKLNIMSNKISWVNDGKEILFMARSEGRDCLYWLDVRRKKVTRKYVPPLRFLAWPSPDLQANKVVFVGMRKSHSEIFIYHVSDGTLEPVFSDLYEKRDPVFSADGKSIYFVSNRNGLHDYESRQSHLFRFDLASQSLSEARLGLEGKIHSPVFSDNGRQLMISATVDGVSDIYLFQVDSEHGLINGKKITNTLGGSFYPVFIPQSNLIMYNSYQNFGYDIAVQDTRRDKELKINYQPNKLAEEDYGDIFVDTFYPSLSSYKMTVYPELVGLAAGYSSYGLVGYARASFSDFMADQTLIMDLGYTGDERNPNYQLTYINKYYRPDLLAGVFRSKNLINVITLENLNEIFYNSNYGTQTLYRYGFFVGASYPFSQYFRAVGRLSASRYEERHAFWFDKEDVFANLHQALAGLVFDNVSWGYFHPLDGWRGMVSAERSFNISGYDHVFNNVEFDIRRYFLFFSRFSLAFRLKAGTVYGQDASYYKYEIGGFGTVRGHPYRRYHGQNMALFNVEYRFPFLDIIKFGGPIPFSLGGISGVWFMDFGAAWDKKFILMNEQNRFETLKASYGYGLRWALLPILIFRLDFATPWDWRSNLPMRRWQGEFSIGFDY